MMRDITLGQYYSHSSVIHRLDPRVKLLGTLVYILTLFLQKHIFGFAAAVLVFCVCVLLSKVPFSYMVRGLRPVLVILVFSSILHLFCTPGTVLFEIGSVHITKEGGILAGKTVLRITLLILGSSLLTLTTTPTTLMDGMEKSLKPLQVFKIPVHEVAMMMSIALRFIPVLLEETDKIMKVQAARGMDFTSGKIWERVKKLVPILVPLFASSIRRAEELALAMESRCYHGGNGRTKLHPLKYQKRDYLGYLCVFIYFCCAVWLSKISVSIG